MIIKSTKEISQWSCIQFRQHNSTEAKHPRSYYSFKVKYCSTQHTILMIFIVNSPSCNSLKTDLHPRSEQVTDILSSSHSVGGLWIWFCWCWFFLFPEGSLLPSLRNSLEDSTGLHVALHSHLLLLQINVKCFHTWR